MAGDLADGSLHQKAKANNLPPRDLMYVLQRLCVRSAASTKSSCMLHIQYK